GHPPARRAQRRGRGEVRHPDRERAVNRALMPLGSSLLLHAAIAVFIATLAVRHAPTLQTPLQVAVIDVTPKPLPPEPPPPKPKPVPLKVARAAKAPPPPVKAPPIQPENRPP